MDPKKAQIEYFLVFSFNALHHGVKIPYKIDNHAAYITNSSARFTFLRGRLDARVRWEAEPVNVRALTLSTTKQVQIYNCLD